MAEIDITQLNRREYEVLRALATMTDSEWRGDGYATPLDVGGCSGSHHSYTLNKLGRMGMVKVAVRSSGIRGSKKYRITEQGQKYLETLRKYHAEPAREQHDN